MDILVVLGVLRRRRRLVALGGVLAVIGGLLVAYHVRPFPPGLTARQTVTGSASARVLVDTAQSELITPAPDGAMNLMDRAELLSDALATQRGMALVARAARVPRRDLLVYDPATLQPVVGVPLALSAAEAAAPAAPYVVAVHLDPELTIVSLDATAPTAAGAARVVDASISALRRIATPKRPGQAPLVTVDDVDPTHARAVLTGPGPAMGAIAAITLFCAWCGSLVVASGVRRAWRRAARPAFA